MADGKAAPTGAPEKLQLDDLMLAMDVVDTLRHRQRLVERELDSGTREKNLIGRLRKIYSDQGIEVPEHILADGVKALGQQRFLYQPPKPGWSTRLARVYVSRSRWTRKLGIALLVLAGLWSVQYFTWQRPKLLRVQQLEQQLTVDLPRELRSARDANLELAATNEVVSAINELFDAGRSALERGDAAAALSTIDELESARGILRSQYAVRIVARPGESSGVWRIPDSNENARNFYLIVEAVNEKGIAMPVRITSEEDQRTRMTRKWGLRVSKEVYNRVGADKEDDGILQDRRVGMKPRGYLEHAYRIETDGGTILDW
ncbi:MAG: hypothetical protein ACI8QZ_000693 [Chlamydiales bacterium]|jgi:hypothetical protein